MALRAGSWGRLGALVGAILLLMPGAARAQVPPKPAVPALPSAPPAPADTAHLVLLHTPGGVRFVFHERGAGPLALPGRRVAVRYAGFLPNGRLFDATAATGGPLRFRVGRREVIAGWDELLPLLPAGSRVRAWVPAALAYGATGVPDPDDESRFVIPPNTELVFELYVVSVK